MTRYAILVVLAACVALSVAQFGQFAGADFSNEFLASSFGSPNYNTLSSASVRDPRADTGPVLFPPSPPGDPSQTSGVVVGASGYGFVPPGSQGPAVPRFFYRRFYFR